MNKQVVAELFPGVMLSFSVAFLATVLSAWLPSLGGATLAILLGILLGNTFFKQDIWSKGTKLSESKLLELAVVLLGTSVTFQTIGKLGIKGLLFILLQMAVTIIGTLWLGKWLKFQLPMTLMMAGGNAVCGSSAIASIAPSIHANEKEKGQIITLVNLQGTVMMLTIPFLASAIFSDNIFAQSAFLGGILQSVGQVVAGASLLSSGHVQLAMLFKILRILMLAFIVIIFEYLAKQPSQKEETPPSQKKRKLPWYIIGFLVLCVIKSTINIPLPVEKGADFIRSWLETTALAAIGLRLNLVQFLKEGPKLLLFGGSVGLLQVFAGIILLSIFDI